MFSLENTLKELGRYKWFDNSKVQLGLNCIGGDYSKCVEDLLSENGCHVTYGGVAEKFISPSIYSLIFKNINFRGFSVNKWLTSHKKDSLCQSMTNDLLSLIHGGKYYRPPFICFPLCEYKDAVDLFHSKKSMLSLPQRILFTKDVSFAQNSITLVKKTILK
ncbi:Trans-2-enoyl-CoA reductase, mitochondrial [Thelohanellus kitauei]|uniref:Trans-2-enoyl-CoA reductase, mitochondrial n=1 Tax=Thelohanellus kitauei TaxID=669202 RepID=A0A0C2N059_THEKT|nr:Trans-2-enoyl-CoA reductase, mitochondrial [Thelohanellus kitauei]